MTDPSPLGEPYVLLIGQGSDTGRWEKDGRTLQFTETEIRFSGSRFRSQLHIPLGEVEAVDVHAAWIQLRYASTSLRIRPANYADRQRLLWELAVRCNAAMERGLDEANRHAGGAAAPAASIENIGEGLTGLGSALAVPATQRNPPPPRKSGLGVGLFPMPPSD